MPRGSLAVTAPRWMNCCSCASVRFLSEFAPQPCTVGDFSSKRESPDHENWPLPGPCISGVPLGFATLGLAGWLNAGDAAACGPKSTGASPILRAFQPPAVFVVVPVEGE